MRAGIIDLDIIYEDQIIREKDRSSPSDAHNRTFVMEPISEIAPFFVHPIYKKTVREIYQELINNLDLNQSKITSAIVW